MEEWVHMRGRTKDSLSHTLFLPLSPPVALSNQRGRKNERAISNTTSQSTSVGPEKGSKTDKTE
jgi:hypothetical protein